MSGPYAARSAGPQPGELVLPLEGDPVDPNPALSRIWSNALGGTELNVKRLGAKGDGVTDDTGAFLDAASSAADTIFIPAGTYWISSTITWPGTMNVRGAKGATIIAYHGTGACFYQHGSNASFNPTFATNGYMRDLTIDGANAGAGAYGLDVGDGWGIDVDVVIRHFNGAGSIGLYAANRNTWSEKCRLRASVQDCTTLVVFDNVGGLPSHVYSDYLFYLYAEAGQSGIVVQGGAEISSSSLFVRGNFQTSSTPLSNVAALVIGADGSTAHMHYSLVHFAVETDSGLTYAPQTVIIGANAYAQENSGLISFLATGGTSFAAATLTGGWNFKGLINGDTALRAVTTPAVPASTVTYTNTGNDAYVAVSGGTVSKIQLGQGGSAGQATGLTSGMFFVGTNDSITLTYSAAPAWQWFSAITY